MSEEKNYNDTVIIPFLQRKVQELTNQNLVLEANLLIERQKVADTQVDLNTVKKELSDLQNQLVEAGLAEDVSETAVETPKKKKKKIEPEVLDASTY